MAEESGQIILPSGRILTLIANADNLGELEAVTKALGSDKRLAILHFLGNHTCSVLEIAEALNLPFTTATQHINILEKAGLIKTDLQPSIRGLKKVCARVYDQIIVQLPAKHEHGDGMVEVSMPVGAYSVAKVVPTCGLAGEIGIIGHLDDPSSFYEPEHIYAQLIWFHKGHVEYIFPNRLPPHAVLRSLELSFEVCSEAPLHHHDWASDVTVWINEREVATWTSPADFGGQRGALTPRWWDEENTQYGLLKIWKVTPMGSYIDGVRTSDCKLTDVLKTPSEMIRVRIGIKENAANVGGINIFGRQFGNYPQDIVLKLHYHRDGNPARTE